MSAQVIQRDRLGELTRIGQGGQGVVYAAPNVKTKFAASMVYKEYKTQVLGGIDFTALAAMPALVEDTLTYKEAERLISLAAWPCALVENSGASSGFVMPVIPAEFFVELTTVKGVSSTTAEFQHLLNHPSVLAARGTIIDEAQRYALLREAASGLAFLHKHGVCIGDISPKNLLYSLTPHEAVYFIDCDAMRINGVSALAQVETPGWQVPSGEELATIYSDTYKLGLLALRLCAGDHDTTNSDHLPPTTPALLRQLITDTLTKSPQQRPLPEAWTYVLGHAIEEAQHRKLTAPTTPVTTVGIAAPQIPTVHSRPSAQRSGYSQPPPSAPPSLQPAGRGGPPPVSPWASPANKSSSSTGAILAVVGVALVVAVIVLTIVLVKNHDGSSQAASTAAYPTYSSAAQAAPAQAATVPAAAAPPVDPQAAALAQLQQFANGDRDYVRDQLAERWVPQLSSKRVGIYDAEDGITYDNASILQEHLRLRSRFDAKLLWSGDWANFDGSNFWVTVANVTFNDSASALAWCQSQGLDADHCYAGVISTTHSGRTAHN
jgi:eukaryotic-like serine/threonine-protein kinase